MGKNSLLFTTSLALLTGCVVGPNYCKPRTEIPEGWRTSAACRHQQCNLEWWEGFGDLVLNSLIMEALSNNHDLLIATARIDEFLGYYRITRSDLFPKIDGEGIAGRQRTSDKIVPPSPGVKNPDNLYRAMLTTSWELDLWGKIRRATQAARADILASEEAQHSVVLSLAAAVATSYVDLLRLDKQLEIAEKTTESRRQTLELFNLRYDAGVISKIDLSQIESEYQSARATIPFFENAIAQQENRINALLGRNPGPIPRGNTLDTLKVIPLPCDMPSDVVAKRPDIREAEQLLIAANARVGVAKAEYFPTLSLTGSYGQASKDLGDFLKKCANEWSYFTPLTFPIFRGGEIAGQVEAAKAVKWQAIELYKQRIVIAFQEVENALVDYSKTEEQYDAQYKQVEALNEYARLARLRYDEGYTSYLEVLDAERSQFSVLLDATETQGEISLAAIALYKAVGGGNQSL